LRLGRVKLSVVKEKDFAYFECFAVTSQGQGRVAQALRGFRISAFGLLSAIGIRPSVFIFQPSALFPCPSVSIRG
jgi:hypothetical protein